MVSIKRKIIRQGHNTLTITLPKHWVDKHQVKGGDEIDVAVQGEILTILPQRDITLPAITVDVRGLTPIVIWRFVSSAYRSGYDEFKILFDEFQGRKTYSAFSYNTMNLLYNEGKQPVLSPIEVIQSVINRCVGIEIIDQRENNCVVKELGETTYKQFDNALRRIFLLMISMSEEILESLTAQEKKNILKSAHLIDTNIDRFTDFCFRVLNKKGYKDFRKTPTMHSILFLLELIGDEYKKIAIHLLEAKQTTKKIIDLFKVQHEQMRRYYSLFYDFKREKCLELYEHDSKGNELNLDMFSALSNDEKEILHHLKKIGIYLTSLTELRIDLEY